jgi:hypothetical protein
MAECARRQITALRVYLLYFQLFLLNIVNIKMRPPIRRSMNFFLRLPYLMATLAVAPLATFADRVAPAAAHSPGCSQRSGIQESAGTFGQCSHTLTFYIPRPPRGPQV